MHTSPGPRSGKGLLTMDHTLPIRERTSGSDIADTATGWTSGTMGQTMSGYNPALLVVEVQNLLRMRGIVVTPTPGMLNTASIAGADLLRALGVEPQSTPVVSAKGEGQ